jgi:hypothetical protein
LSQRNESPLIGVAARQHDDDDNDDDGRLRLSLAARFFFCFAWAWAWAWAWALSEEWLGKGREIAMCHEVIDELMSSR